MGDTRHTKDLKDEVLASFELRVPDGLDEAHQLPLTFAVHDTHGNTDAIEVTRDIIPAQTTVSVAEFLDVREPTDLVLASHADARESQAHIRVYADMFDALEWIPDFAHARNYGCSEQTFTDYTASLIYADLTSTPISPSTQDLIKARNFIESTQVQGG